MSGDTPIEEVRLPHEEEELDELAIGAAQDDVQSSNAATINVLQAEHAPEAKVDKLVPTANEKVAEVQGDYGRATFKASKNTDTPMLVYQSKRWPKRTFYFSYLSSNRGTGEINYRCTRCNHICKRRPELGRAPEIVVKNARVIVDPDNPNGSVHHCMTAKRVTNDKSQSATATAQIIVNNAELCLPDKVMKIEPETIEDGARMIVDRKDSLKELCQGMRKKFGPLMGRLSEAEDAVDLCDRVTDTSGAKVNPSSVRLEDIPDVKVGAAGGLKLALLQCRTAVDEFLQQISANQLCDIATYTNSATSSSLSRSDSPPETWREFGRSFTAEESHSPSTSQTATQRHASQSNSSIRWCGDIQLSASTQRNHGHDPLSLEGQRMTQMHDDVRDIRMESKFALGANIGVIQSEYGAEYLDNTNGEAGHSGSGMANPNSTQYVDNSEVDDVEDYDTPSPDADQLTRSQQLSSTQRNMGRKRMEWKFETEQEPVMYIETCRGLKRAYKNYLYSLDKTKNTKSGIRTWRCVKRHPKYACRARIHDDLQGNVQKSVGQHTHPAMIDEIRVAMTLERGKLLASNADTNAAALVKDICSELSDAATTPNDRAIKRRLLRFRRKMLDTPPQRIRPAAVAVHYANADESTAAYDDTTTNDRETPVDDTEHQLIQVAPTSTTASLPDTPGTVIHEKGKMRVVVESKADIEPVVYLDSPRGLRRVYRNYIYSLEKTKVLKGNLRTWRCIKRNTAEGCRARINDDEDGIVRRRIGQHSHPALHDEIRVAKATQDNSNSACCSQSNASDLIMQQISSELAVTAGTAVSPRTNMHKNMGLKSEGAPNDPLFGENDSMRMNIDDFDFNEAMGIISNNFANTA